MDWHQFSPGGIQVVQNFFQDRPLPILRLDLLKSWSSGNKYYKLKYPLQFAIENNVTKVVSKGGMFSNHLAALAEACHTFQLHFTAVVRAFEPDERNPTLRRLRELNTQIVFVQPEEYHPFDQAMAYSLFPDALFIEEGGLSMEGIKGSAEIMNEIPEQGIYHLAIAAGSMCTACGILDAMPSNYFLHIVPAWKGCDRQYVQSLLSRYDIVPAGEWDIWPDYHLGGFGKFNPALIDFMTSFTRATQVVLDPVYTGKLLFGIADKMKAHYFHERDQVLAIHTGGLQGLAGYAYRFPDLWGEYYSMAKALLASHAIHDSGPNV